jgi:carbon monoxide dehydrogenase subunit G
MAKVSVSVDLDAGADVVWELLGDFNGLHQWHPAIAASRVEVHGGREQRILSVTGGDRIIEQLEEHDPEARRYVYTLVEGPMPVADYRSTLEVIPLEGERSRVVWSGRFDAAGVTESEAEKVIESVYQTGLDALKLKFNAQRS